MDRPDGPDGRTPFKSFSLPEINLTVGFGAGTPWILTGKQEDHTDTCTDWFLLSIEKKVSAPRETVLDDDLI